MTAITPIHLAAPRMVLLARRYPRPVEAGAARRIRPWVVYLLLITVSLAMWYLLGTLAMLLWRLPFP